MTFIPGTPIYEPSAGGGGDMWNMLIPAGISMFGNMLNAGAQNKANKEQNQIQREALQLNREQDRRAEESDIFRKLAQMAYLKNGGARDLPNTIKYGGQDVTLPSYGFGPRPASEQQMTAAQQMEEQLMQRLQRKVTPASMPADVDSSMNLLAGMGNPAAAKQIQDFIRSRTGRAGY